MRDHRKRSTNPAIQHRTVELRANVDGPGFSGHASRFWNVDSWWTAMKPGAFKKTIAERGDKVPVLWQHWTDAPIGRPTELKEDKVGLAFNAQITETSTYGRDAMALLRDGVPLGMSFGFQTIRSRPGTDADPIEFGEYKGKPEEIEIIEEVRLWEISVVTFPANDQATIESVRASAHLATLIEHLRAGTLTDADEALVADLVAAWEERAGAGGHPPTTPPAAPARPRIREAQGLLALRQLGIAGA